MKFLSRTAALSSLLMVVLGCSGGGPTVVPVKGIATRGGQPIKNLFILFIPEEGRRSSASTDDNGHFELSYLKEQKGAILGAHKVVVAFRPRSPQEEAEVAAGRFTFHPEQDAILEKYGDQKTTALTVEITQPTDSLELKFD